jgi:IS605 OrfB family transposase
MLRRAVKVSLKFATAKKCRVIKALLAEYRAAVNFYCKSLWAVKGKLDAATANRLPLSKTRLSYRYRGAALRQALDIVIATRKAAKATGRKAAIPRLKGAARLSSLFVGVETGKGSFDLVLKLSTLKKGQRIVLPLKKTKVLNKWLAMPGAQIVQGCALREDVLTLWVEMPLPEPKPDGKTIGLDVGINKLISDSDGNHYGTDFKEVRNRVRRRKPGSKGKRRARIARDQFISRIVKQLPWEHISTIGMEDLNGLKTGKQPGRGKRFRRALAPWVYRQVRQRVENMAAPNRVRVLFVNPRGTSRTCPSCGAEHKANRKGELFACITCNHRADADTVGAQNILDRTSRILGSLLSPKPDGPPQKTSGTGKKLKA